MTSGVAEEERTILDPSHRTGIADRMTNRSDGPRVHATSDLVLYPPCLYTTPVLYPAPAPVFRVPSLSLSFHGSDLYLSRDGTTARRVSMKLLRNLATETAKLEACLKPPFLSDFFPVDSWCAAV